MLVVVCAGSSNLAATAPVSTCRLARVLVKAEEQRVNANIFEGYYA